MGKGRKKIVALVLLLLLAFVGSEVIKKEARPVAGAPGELAIFAVISEPSESIQAAIDSSVGRLDRQNLSVVRPGQPFVISFLLTGLLADVSNEYHYIVDAYILAPGENPIWGKQGYAHGRREARVEREIVLAEPALELVLETDKPAGRYAVFVQVTDKVSGDKAEDNITFIFLK